MKFRVPSSRAFLVQKLGFCTCYTLFVHFSAVTARLRRENAKFHDLQSTYTSDDKISSLFLNLEMVLRNVNLGGFTNI